MGLLCLCWYRAVLTGSHPEYYSLRMLDDQLIWRVAGTLHTLEATAFTGRVRPDVS